MFKKLIAPATFALASLAVPASVFAGDQGDLYAELEVAHVCSINIVDNTIELTPDVVGGSYASGVNTDAIEVGQNGDTRWGLTGVSLLESPTGSLADASMTVTFDNGEVLETYLGGGLDQVYIDGVLNQNNRADHAASMTEAGPFQSGNRYYTHATLSCIAVNSGGDYECDNQNPGNEKCVGKSPVGDGLVGYSDGDFDL